MARSRIEGARRGGDSVSSYIGMAATAGALFVFLLVMATFVIPYLNTVQAAIAAIAR